MTITIQSLEHREPISANLSDYEPLSIELQKALGEQFGGISSNGQTFVHIYAPVDDETIVTIKDVLDGYELRIGGDAHRKDIIQKMHGRYDEPTVQALESGNPIEIVDAIVRQADPEDEEAVIAASRSPEVQNILKAHRELLRKLNVGDIGPVLLGELRADLGDKIADLGLKDGDAYVLVRSEPDAALLKKVHEIVASYGTKES